MEHGQLEYQNFTFRPLALIELVELAESVESEFPDALRGVAYVAKVSTTEVLQPFGWLCSKELHSEIVGSTLLTQDGERSYLGKTPYREAMVRINELIWEHQLQKGFICQVDCSKAPSISPEDIAVLASAYKH